jgi:hypothetical protein
MAASIHPLPCRRVVKFCVTLWSWHGGEGVNGVELLKRERHRVGLAL